MVDSPVSDDEEDFEQRRDKFRSERDEVLSVSSGNVQNPAPTSTDPAPTNPPSSLGSTAAKNPTSQSSNLPVTTSAPATNVSSPALSTVSSHKRLASQRDERPKSPEYKRSGSDRGRERYPPRSPPRGRDYEGRSRYPPRRDYDRDRDYDPRDWDPRDRDSRRDPRDREWDPRDRDYWDREQYERDIRERERYRGRDHRERDIDRYREDRRPEMKRRRDDWGRVHSPGHVEPLPMPPIPPTMPISNRYVPPQPPLPPAPLEHEPKSSGPYHHGSGFRPSAHPSSHPSSGYRPDKKRRKGVREDDSLYEGPLKTYKQFLETQDDNIQPGEAQKRFEEYQLEYKWRQAKTFFNDNKNSEWFKEKYHPTYLEKSKIEKAALCKQNVVQFLEDYNSDNFHPSLSAEDINVVETAPTTSSIQPKKEEEKSDEKKEENETPASREEEEEEEEEEDSEDTHHRKVIKETPAGLEDHQTATSEANIVQRTVFVKTIPPHWGKAELTEHLNSLEDCKITKITFSEPNRQKNFHRLAWATYETEAQASKVIAELNGKKFKDYDLLLGVNKPSDKEKAKKARATPPLFCSEERMKIDLEQTKTLAKIFDEQREIKDNPLFSSDFDSKYRTLKEKLDAFVTYLRRVHIFCYYCGEDYEHADDMIRKCGTTHYRSNTPTAMNENALLSTWEMKIQEHLSGSAFGRDSIDRYLEDFYGEYTKKIEEAKYACGFCNKLFKGPQFIKKHINLKHPEQVEERKGKAIEEQFFLNYFNDPRKLLPLPSPVSIPLPQPPSHMKQQLPQPPPQINLSNINVSLSNAGALNTLHALTGVQVVPNMMNPKQSLPQPPIPPIPPPLPPNLSHHQQPPLHPPTPPVPPLPPHMMPPRGQSRSYAPLPPNNMMPMPPIPPPIPPHRSRGNWSWRRGDREDDRGEERRPRPFPPSIRPSHRPAPPLPVDPRAAEFGAERRLLEYVDLDAPGGEQEDYGVGFFDWGKVIEKHKSTQTKSTETQPQPLPSSSPSSSSSSSSANTEASSATQETNGGGAEVAPQPTEQQTTTTE